MNSSKHIAFAAFVAAHLAFAQAAPLAIGTDALTNAWVEAGISAYKCRIAFKNFGKDIADANAEAAAKRTQLDTTARVYLKSQMEKAQAEGDLDRVLVFKSALESARGGAITGDDEAVVKLRESYDRQLALADKTLLDAGLAAARAFAASLDEQKKESTKRGDLDDAQKIAAFQRKVGEWTKAVQGQATPAEVQRPPAPPRPPPRPQPQPRQTVREVKPVEPKTKIVTIDARSDKGTSIGKASYCVVDLSAGVDASSYPVTYLAEPPSHGFNVDEYKTTKLVLKRIEAGSYKMGGSINVTLTKPFFIGLFEVTQKQWSLVTGDNPSRFSGDKRPVEKVSYNAIRGLSEGANWPASSAVDSSSFLGMLRARTGLNFDLPTEAQWEYACRAGTTTIYSYGNSADGNYMWYDDNSSSQTHEVGTKKPNPWGLYDMHGNVWEWCRDWYADNPSGGSNPQGFSSGSSRVLRGGSKYRDASYCTSSNRGDNSPSRKDRDDFGFRLAMTIN